MVALEERNPLYSGAESGSSLPEGKVQQQLQRILASPDFDGTGQQRALLRFVVQEALAGNSHVIKGYTIATQVFGRDENFNQAIDPIVSIQANKVRRSLERYYLLSGKEDAIRIEIPKGTYVPVFRKQTWGTKKPPSRRSQDQDICCDGAWPTLVIKPFHNLINCPEKNSWGAGFASELAAEINRYQWISVLQYGPEGQPKRSSDTGARFVVDGNIREDKTGGKVVINLMDAKTNKLIWSGTQRFDGDLIQLIEFQEKAAVAVGAKIAGERGIIARTLSVESKSKPTTRLKTYEAILRYHQYDQTLSPEDFLRAFAALENARIHEPECGQVWSFLGRLYANIFSLEVPGFDVADAENKALEYAVKGARLNPDNQGAMCILAFVRMLSNDIPAARREINLAYELNPDSLFMMDGIGYIKTLLGDWEHGPALIRKIIRLNPFYEPMVHFGLWVDCLRQQDFQNAYLETTGLRRPATFWYPLAKASTLGLLGRIDEGKQFAENLLELKPDFSKRGRALIKKYIKFDDIVGSTIEGLNKVGLAVEHDE